eukprot:maker-scaffold427_size174323-snap-gene-0.41 protein:Tk04513 transcript:maker-scaffold427_size174323-snap-gene-0.41-mRNA-1 annotation:"fad synthase-like isoform x1"
MASTAVRPCSVGLIIIGDEILKGQTRDTNTFYLARQLRSLGVLLTRVSVIPDDVSLIAHEVRDFSQRFDVVLTSGGIGPTHDDLTFDGVAQAFDDQVKYHPEIVTLVKTWFKTEDPEAPALKLALVPSRAKLNFEWSHTYFKIKLTLEAQDKTQLDLALAAMESSIPTISFDPAPFENAMPKVQKLLAQSSDPAFNKVLREALDTIEQTFSDYTQDQIAVCFNGGKDCIVMLHLVHAYFQKRFPQDKLQTIYIKETNPFPEVAEFILKAEAEYKLDAFNIDGGMKKALKSMLLERPRIKSAFLGTRKGDPGSHTQSLFSPTDGDWPDLMRVNPILNWDYAHVWTFIRGLCLTYPSLYDQGYTSLGSRSNTDKNPQLQFTDTDGVHRYKPAYELQDGAFERAGRISRAQ